MENIQIKDPHSNKEIVLKISPEKYEEKQAWRVQFEDGKEALMGVDEHGIWKQLDDNTVDEKLISEISKAIEEKQRSL